MKYSAVQQKLKPWMLPIAIVCGALFHTTLDRVQWLVPYLIFCMLFITFCRIRPSELKISAMSWYLLAVQLFGSIAVFLLLRPAGLTLAQSAFICVFCPTATAAPVVTGMLGGNIGRVAAYSFVSNLTVAVTAPFLFLWTGSGNAAVGFVSEFWDIVAKVAPTILLPAACAFALYYFARPVHDAVDRYQGISFYLWSVSLLLVVGKAVSFVMREPASAIPEMICIALVSCLLCLLQFYAGRRIGRRTGDAVSGAQGLGQKNTVLAVWMTLVYFNPLASIGPAAYIVWQNTINSGQLYYKMKREQRSLRTR